jgi:hypothetical protein
LIGNLVQDARVIERGDKEPMVALKVATVDPIGREAREAGKGTIYDNPHHLLETILVLIFCSEKKK